MASSIMARERDARVVDRRSVARQARWTRAERQRWLAANPHLVQADNWHGPMALLGNWAAIVVVVLGAEHQRAVPRMLFYVTVVLPVIATRMRALATMMHEGAHGCLARTPWLNRALATYLSSYTVMQTSEAYRRSHVRDHHGKHNRVGSDPDLDGHIADGLYDEASPLKFVLRFLVGPLLLVRHVRMWRNLVRARLAAVKLTDDMTDAERKLAHKTRAELPLVVLTNVTLAALWIVIGGWTEFLIFWVIPLLYGFPIANWFCELVEHFPYPVTRKGAPLWHTRHRAVGPLTRHFFGIMNEGYHWLHHEAPQIPFWKLPAAMRQLEAEYPEIAFMVHEQGAARWRPFGLTRQIASAITESTANARKENM